jgi:adenylate kinase
VIYLLKLNIILGVVIVFLGPPASGKGTQAKLLAQNQFCHFALGDILRKESQTNSELGNTIRKYIESGSLVPDDIIFEIFEKFTNKQKIIFDGFPRTEAQAKKFVSVFKPEDCLVIEFDVSEKQLLNRMRSRAATEKRQDDTEEIFKSRLKDYNIHKEKILRVFSENQFEIQKIDGNLSQDVIAAQIMALIKQFEQSKKVQS